MLCYVFISLAHRTLTAPSGISESMIAIPGLKNISSLQEGHATTYSFDILKTPFKTPKNLNVHLLQTISVTE